MSKNDNIYRHLLLEKDGEKNFITKQLYELTKDRFSQHKAGDLRRIMTNTASSQAYCFNLMLHLNENKELANALFTELFQKPVVIHHIEPEFTPNKMHPLAGFENEDRDETIGDQTEIWGTDADVAVFYTYDGNKKGVLLIEFKFIEAEFSVCSSYKKKVEARSICGNEGYYERLITNKLTDKNLRTLCGYNKYENWQLTEVSSVLDNTKIKESNACPFRFGLNQLWRNLLLAEKVASARCCDEFGFWVFSPQPNDAYLWKEKNEDVEILFREILTEKGNTCFRKVHLEEVFKILDSFVTEIEDKEWLQAMKEKYLIS